MHMVWSQAGRAEGVHPAKKRLQGHLRAHSSTLRDSEGAGEGL